MLPTSASADILIVQQIGALGHAMLWEPQSRGIVPRAAATSASRSTPLPCHVVVVVAALPLPHPARVPAGGAELAAVDDAVILVAGGAEGRGAADRAVGDVAFEQVGDRAAFVARGE